MRLFLLSVWIYACFLTMTVVVAQTCVDESIDTRRLKNFFDETARINFRNSTSVLTYRPTQSLQGFGNLMVGTYGMILLAHAKAAVPIVAHSMVASMFDHPLSDEGLSFQNLLEEPDGTVSLPSVSASGPDMIRDGGPGDVSYINVLGTGDALKRGPARNLYADLLNMSTTDPRLYDIMSTAAAQWMLSNPSPLFQQLYDDYKTEKLSQCSSSTDHFDFGIQIRSWKDWTAYYSFFEKNKPCIVDCIADVIRSHINLKKDSPPPCVFFTSDSGADAADLINMLKSTLLLSDVVADIVISAPPTQTVAEIEHSGAYKSKNANDKPFSWRSDFVLRTSRESFNIDDLSKRTDLLDWMLLGDVGVGVYTGGSTFGRTARMRRGYQAQSDDYIVTTRANAPVKGRVQQGCMCKAVQPKDYSAVKYNGLGVMVL